MFCRSFYCRIWTVNSPGRKAFFQCEGVTQFGEWALQVLEQGWFESGVHWKERLLEKRCYLLNMFSVTQSKPKQQLHILKTDSVKKSARVQAKLEKGLQTAGKSNCWDEKGQAAGGMKMAGIKK